LLYLLFNFQSSTRRFRNELRQAVYKCGDLFTLPGAYAFSGAGEYNAQIQYLSNFAGFPAYGRTKTEFLPSGEQKLERLVEVLKKAEKYIFLEYFSISEGVLWNTVLEVLKEKAAGGVDVRVIYDDVGCFLLRGALRSCFCKYGASALRRTRTIRGFIHGRRKNALLKMTGLRSRMPTARSTPKTWVSLSIFKLYITRKSIFI
jgi:phosphatidylserine/phosphatidylglycerophosphate/cardiolipin synthase-like enzyme